MEKRTRTLVSFDWAIKGLLRDKTDHVIVEGLLTSLLGRKITVENILESASNKKSPIDKYNCVDVLAVDDKGEIMLFEIQNDYEADFIHRMTYATSKAMTDRMSEGYGYARIPKVYSINIVYFNLGDGNGYAYHGSTTFRNVYNSEDLLHLSEQQKRAYGCEEPQQILPEYYILKVNNYNKEKPESDLDEWISFLKTSKIPESFTAPGLKEARDKLEYYLLSDADRLDYDAYIHNWRVRQNVMESHYSLGIMAGEKKGIEKGREEGREEGRKEGREEGREEVKINIAKSLLAGGMDIEMVSNHTQLPVDVLKQIINNIS